MVVLYIFHITVNPFWWWYYDIICPDSLILGLVQKNEYLGQISYRVPLYFWDTDKKPDIYHGSSDHIRWTTLRPVTHNTTQVLRWIFLHLKSVIHIVICLWSPLPHFTPFDQWSGGASLHSGWRNECGRLVEAHTGLLSRQSTEQSEPRRRMERQIGNSRDRSSFSCNKAQSGVLWVTARQQRGVEDTENHLELSTMYCTSLSRTFSKRAVRTQMCLMAWAERGWGGRLVVEEPCLLRGSWLTLWVLLRGTKHNTMNNYPYREQFTCVKQDTKYEYNRSNGIHRVLFPQNKDLCTNKLCTRKQCEG